MRTGLISICAAFLSVLVLAGCTNTETAPNIKVENVRVHRPLPGQTTAVAYFDIINSGGPDNLLRIQSAISPNAELHNHIHEDGIMKMRRVDSVTVAKNTVISFERGGLHVMLFEATIPPDALSVPLSLQFSGSGIVDIVANLED